MPKKTKLVPPTTKYLNVIRQGYKDCKLSKKSLNTKKVFFFKYLTHNGIKKKADNTLLIDYFNKYHAFCFDLSFDSVLKGKINFKYK